MASEPKRQHSSRDRRFYLWAAIAAAVIVLTGFARTYYLKGLFGSPALSGLVHLHGLVMTFWVLLFIAQTRLVAVRRTDLHRRFGVLGGLLAGLVLVMGTITAIAAAKRGGEGPPPPLVFLAVPLGDMLVFAGFVGAGFSYRRRPDIHKRFMLLSCGAFLTAAIARIPLTFIETGGPLIFFGLTDLCLLACVAIDTLKHRRLHPVFGWGVLLLIASQPLRLMLSETQLWLRFAAWLTS
jgi:hypothetical protein